MVTGVFPSPPPPGMNVFSFPSRIIGLSIPTTLLADFAPNFANLRSPRNFGERKLQATYFQSHGLYNTMFIVCLAKCLAFETAHGVVRTISPPKVPALSQHASFQQSVCG